MTQELFKNEEPKNEGRKLFPNKKLNIALGTVFVVMIVAIIGLSIWVNV